jgi:hypothetical protein
MTEEAKTYKTAGAFRTALETRLQNRARGRNGSATSPPASGLRPFSGADVFEGT